MAVRGGHEGIAQDVTMHPGFFRPDRELTKRERVRLERVFHGALFFWMVGPGMLVGISAAIVGGAIWPDPLSAGPSASLVLVKLPAFGLGFGITTVIGFVFYVRRFIRYRTARKGRTRMLIECLGNAKLKASWLRRVQWRIYGINQSDLIRHRAAIDEISERES